MILVNLLNTNESSLKSDTSELCNLYNVTDKHTPVTTDCHLDTCKQTDNVSIVPDILN